MTYGRTAFFRHARVWILLAFAATASFPETVMRAQSTVTGVFFSEGWESGSTGGTFASRNYGSSTTSQFRVQSAVRNQGSFALEHFIANGVPASQIQWATQHFGDAISTPIHSNGQGQRFNDIYIQYKIYYSPGFDLANGQPKQLIIGTEDERRHDAACCNPWVSHYLTIVPPHTTRSTMVAEANNKSGAGQWIPLAQNRGGYSGSNLFVTQTGRWYTVEVRRRLNDSGVDNGIFQMWIDGALLSEHTTVRYRIPWNGTLGSNMNYGTNFAMISDYMAIGSTRDQSVFYDDIRMSTTYIGVGNNQLTAPTNLRVVGNP